MSNEAKFKVGDDVTPRDGSRGNVIDVRESTHGANIVGVVTTNGRVDYYHEAAIRSSEGMGGYPIKLGLI